MEGIAGLFCQRHILLDGDIRNRCGNRHRNENHAAGNRSCPNITGNLVEQPVKNWKKEHHNQQSKNHIHIQPDFGAIAPVSIERCSCGKIAYIVNQQDKRQANAVCKRAHKNGLPLAPALPSYAAIHPDGIGDIEHKEDGDVFKRRDKHPLIERRRGYQHESEILVEHPIADLDKEIKRAE